MAEKMTRILSLDDVPEILYVIRLIVEPHGYNLWSTHDSYEAWALLHTLSFDLLMQDTLRQDIDGFDFLHLMRADAGLVDMPVLIVSAHAGDERLRKKFVTAYKVDGYLQKIPSPQNFLAAIRSILLKRDKTVPPKPQMIEDLCSFDKCIAALHNADSKCRYAALVGWGQSGRKEKWPIEPPIQALGDSEANVRLAAIRALRLIGDSRVVNPLVGLLDDTALEVRLAAIQALGLLGYPQAAKALLEQLGDTGIRWAILFALGRIGAMQVVDPVIEALHDENPLVRMMAARSLGYLKEERGIAPLTDCLSDDRTIVRMSAIQALRDIDSEQAKVIIKRQSLP